MSPSTLRDVASVLAWDLTLGRLGRVLRDRDHLREEEVLLVGGAMVVGVVIESYCLWCTLSNMH